MDMYAVLVTNDDVYDLKVRGQLLNNTWTNIAFRFEKYIDTASLPYLSRGGLEVLNLILGFLLFTLSGRKKISIKRLNYS
jgi:hypothetical protein